MHQPPTIPEGDEENEGVEQVGEGTHFPQRGSQAQQQVPPAHDSAATAAELQTREDEGAGLEETPTLQNEMTAVGDGITTEEPQQAENEEDSSAEKPSGDDETEGGVPNPTDAEHEEQGQVDEQEALSGIQEKETVLDESAAVPESEGDKSMTMIPGSPAPPVDESLLVTPHAVSTDENIRSDEISVSIHSIFK